MKKILLYGFALSGLMASMLSSCGSDDVTYPSINPDIIENDGHTVTSFSLQSSHFYMPENVDSVRVALIGKTGTSECFGAGVERTDETIRFRMVIPSDVSLPDGRYILTMRHPDGSSIPGRLSADFKSGMLSDVSIIIPKYMLDGSGTEEDPYLIESSDDFSMFLINLADDAESYGAGLVFKQTADVVAPDQSSLIPGRGYWGAPFAGIYDGNRHTISSLFYHGSQRESSDAGIGLFTELLGTASVSNLTLSSVAMSGLCKECGALTALTSGEISVSNVSISGYVNDGNQIGGLVGKVESGTLTLSDISLRMNVEGNEDIGGLVGKVEKAGKLIINGVSTPDYHFSIAGNHNVGGIVGQAVGATKINNVRLEHKVSGEDADIRIIEAKVGCVGGIIGGISSDASTQELKKCYVLCPIGGDEAECVGGFVGYTAQATHLWINACRMQSVLTGLRYIGGMVGKGELPAHTDGLSIAGTDFGTRVSADDADAKITGTEYVGGIAGWWKGNCEAEEPMRINLPISGNKYVGGAFGELNESKVSTKNVVFGPGKDNSQSNTMRVTGNNCTGGVVGLLTNSTLTGTNKFELPGNFLPSKFPDPESDFSGVVIGGEDAGGIVGQANGSVLEYLGCAATVNGSHRVGGIVGYFYEPDNRTLLKSCYFMGKLDLPNISNVGGIVGKYYSKAQGVITGCVNYSDIRGGYDTGGIAGVVEKNVPKQDCSADERYFEMTWCVNGGDIEGTTYIGGIVGHFYAYFVGDYPTVDMLLAYSMNCGKITGVAEGSINGIGGIAGHVQSMSGVVGCANHGDVTGNGNFHGVGGVLGIAGIDSAGAGLLDKYLNTDVKECMNTATVTSTDANSFVGGVIGYLEERSKSNVNNCHNSGAVPCKQNHDSGGIVGCVDHLTNIYRVVNQGMVSHGNAIIGTHKSGSLFDHGSLYYLEGTGSNWPSATKVSKADFSKESSFKGLDFKDIWEMTSNGPALQHCPFRNRTSL